MEMLEVYYQEKYVNPFEILYILGIDYHYYQKLLHYLSSQNAFDLLISLSKSDPVLLNSKVAAGTEILMHYSSINDFCIKHKIRYKIFLNLLERNRTMSFFELLEEYLKTSDDSLSLTFKNIYCGVSVEAICIKFQLNYKAFSQFYDNKKPFEEQIFLFLLKSMPIPNQIKRQIEQKITFLWSAKMEDIFHLFPSDVTVQCAFDYYQKYMQMKDALNAYYIADFFHNGWQELYQKQISMLHKLNLKCSNFKALEKYAKMELFHRFSFEKVELDEIYQEFYSDYSKYSSYNQDVWIYKRSKII